MTHRRGVMISRVRTNSWERRLLGKSSSTKKFQSPSPSSRRNLPSKWRHQHRCLPKWIRCLGRLCRCRFSLNLLTMSWLVWKVFRIHMRTRSGGQRKRALRGSKCRPTCRRYRRSWRVKTERWWLRWRRPKWWMSRWIKSGMPMRW